VKDEPWDQQWDDPTSFLAWLSTVADEWRRVLVPNGSLYCFASPRMAGRVELMLSERFHVLNHIVWCKTSPPGFDGWKKKCSKASLRSWYDDTERLIFAEQSSGFASLLKVARAESGLSAKDLTERIGAYGKVNHGGAVSNWEAGLNTPTREQYERLREVLRLPPWEEGIRPFQAPEGGFTDAWSFETVRPYRGKHPCEKPKSLLSRIIEASSRPGDVVLDCFMGGGSTGEAALQLGRAFWGCDMSPHWARYSQDRLEALQAPSLGDLLESLVSE
jgi:site-specific DNA-methyltransferase (adenine-specific)